MASPDIFRFKPPSSREAAEAIIGRLSAADTTDRFDPFPGMNLSPEARHALAHIRIGMLAEDFFAGRLRKHERHEAARGIAQLAYQRLGRGDVYALALADSDLFETVDSFWELVDRIALWAKQVSGVALAPYTFASDLIVAAAICLYYWKFPPTPTACTVTELDKWRHCYVGCKLGFWASNGFAWGTLMALLKELLDAAGMGTADVEDFVETIRGVGACGYFQSCEDCCCEKGY